MCSIHFRQTLWSSCNQQFRWSHPNCPICLNRWSSLLADIRTRHWGLFSFPLSFTSKHVTKVVQSSPAKATLSGLLQSHGWATRGDSLVAWALYVSFTLQSLNNVWNWGERIEYFSFSCFHNQKPSENTALHGFKFTSNLIKICLNCHTPIAFK